MMDRETGGQEKCMSLLERIVLCSIATKRRYMYRREGGRDGEGGCGGVLEGEEY